MKKPQVAHLNVLIDNVRATVPRAAYVKAKAKQLREFGYTKLTESEVDEQVTAVLQKKELTNGLTVIGGFMQDEILSEVMK